MLLHLVRSGLDHLGILLRTMQLKKQMICGAIPNYIFCVPWAEKADLPSFLLTTVLSISVKPECVAGQQNAAASPITTVGVAPKQETEVMQAFMVG